MKKIIEIKSIPEESRILLEVEEKDINKLEGAIEKYNQLYEEELIDYDIMTYLEKNNIKYIMVEPYKTYHI